jgi:hypothetical protein
MRVLPLPARRPKPARKHRASDEAGRLKALLDGALLCVKGLRVQLDDQEREHAATIARIDARHAETVRELERQIADFKQRLDVAVKAEHVIAPTQEIPAEQVLTLWQARDTGRLDTH